MDPEQLCRIWDQHHATLLLIARSMHVGMTEADAEDAVQEAFISLSSEDEAPDRIVGWMVRVIRNRILDWKRREHRRRNREHEQAQACWFVDGEDGVMDRENLQAALRSLPDLGRQIVVLHLWGSMTFAEIARSLGTSKSQAHREYQSAIVALKTYLAREDDIREVQNGIR